MLSFDSHTKRNANTIKVRGKRKSQSVQAIAEVVADGWGPVAIRTDQMDYTTQDNDWNGEISLSAAPRARSTGSNGSL
jgi:hypothetical protein